MATFKIGDKVRIMNNVTLEQALVTIAALSTEQHTEENAAAVRDIFEGGAFQVYEQYAFMQDYQGSIIPYYGVVHSESGNKLLLPHFAKVFNLRQSEIFDAENEFSCASIFDRIRQQFGEQFAGGYIPEYWRVSKRR